MLKFFFQTVCEFCIEHFCSSCKFKIRALRSCSSQRNSFENGCWALCEGYYITDVDKITNAFIKNVSHVL